MLSDKIKNSIVKAILPLEPDKIILSGSSGYSFPVFNFVEYFNTFVINGPGDATFKIRD